MRRKRQPVPDTAYNSWLTDRYDIFALIAPDMKVEVWKEQPGKWRASIGDKQLRGWFPNRDAAQNYVLRHAGEEHVRYGEALVRLSNNRSKGTGDGG